MHTLKQEKLGEIVSSKTKENENNVLVFRREDYSPNLYWSQDLQYKAAGPPESNSMLKVKGKAKRD